jgi:hypothetical protein
MKKTLLFLLLICFGLLIEAQEMNKLKADEKTGNEILIGNCTFEGLMNCTFKTSYLEQYSMFKPDSALLEMLQGKMNNISCIIVLGTWCDDSKEQVPRFMKVLDSIKGPGLESLAFVCVDRKKEIIDPQTRPVENIEKVPTFIFYHGQEEIGRIVETPKVSLERDMYEIVKNF